MKGCATVILSLAVSGLSCQVMSMAGQASEARRELQTGTDRDRTLAGKAKILRPEIDGPWWTVAGNPELGNLSSPKQQPVDFCIWQAADGTWQLWSCVRGTSCGGKTRLFYRWEANRLTDSDWRPIGIAMQAEERYGETPGGLQAPHVTRVDGEYVMLYGDWERICMARSDDGKGFRRVVQANGKTGIFGEGAGSNTRDPMLLRVGNLWHCYYTAFPEKQGAVYCRTSPDLGRWGPSVNVAFGGQAGTGPFSAECPFVVALDGLYYLFRTQQYGKQAKTSIYHSDNSLDFGTNDDEKHLIGTLPVAAPEIVLHDGRWYIAALRPDLKGIHIARLTWKNP